MKKAVFLALIVCLALPCACRKEPSDGVTPVKRDPGQLKVMTFNIRSKTNEKDFFNNWCMRGGACRMMVEDQQPSIVGMQELVQEQWDYMNETLTMKGYAAVGEKDCMNSYLYRPDELTVEQTDLFWLTNTPDRSSESWDGYVRSARWTIMRINATGQRIFYVTTHLGLTSDSRQKAMNLITARIKQYNTDNLPVILMADFNIPADNSLFDGIRATMDNSREVAPVTDDIDTYNAWNGTNGVPCIIDMIWLSKSIECSEYCTVTKSYDGHRFISDHYPVYAMIKL